MPADAGELPALKIIDQVIKPILIRPAVVVGERYDFALRRSDPSIARRGKALIGLADATNRRKEFRNFGRPVR